MGDLKSMAVFYVDNQHMWPPTAVLLKNLVVWPDAGKYPSYTPVALANHPEFDGKIVVQAGNRGIVVSLLAGAETPEDIRASMSGKPEQYRIAIESVVHAIMLMRAQTEGERNDAHPVTLLNMLKDTSEGANLRDALKHYLATFPKDADVNDALTRYGQCEDLLEALAPTPEPAPSLIVDPDAP
jgi:hypothetical protein